MTMTGNRIIKDFGKGITLEYGRGSFDDWCVYLRTPSRKRAPKDEDYFRYLYNISQTYTPETIYTLFVTVYDMVGNEIEESCLRKITELTSQYGNESLRMDVVMTILYMAMISEERKENSILGKRIKRLGVYSLLFDNMSIKESANFMRGKKWRILDELCRERGF